MMQPDESPIPPEPRRWIALLCGAWLLVAAAYALSSPGRIDTIDGQFKFETAASLYEHGDFALRDRNLLGVLGFPRQPYSSYAAGPSLTALPLIALGYRFGDGTRELPQFFFALCSALLGALIPVLLLRAWRPLGVVGARALRWAMVAAFGSLLWPIAASCFDQVQQGLILLAAVLLTEAAGRLRRVDCALAGGASMSALLHFQPIYAALLAPLLLGVLDRPLRFERAALRLPAALIAGVVPGLLALLAYNQHRFGSPFVLASNAAQFGAARVGGAVAAVGGAVNNPLVGALVLALSPGKSVLLFSPVIAVALLGVRALWAKNPRLGRLIVAVSLTHFAMISCLPFPGGDWCWGPRYLTVTMPLLLLALPFGAGQLRRSLLVAILVASVGVQALGLSLDHERFFFERGLTSTFWLNNHGFYFRDSQLKARVDELLDPEAPRRFPFWSSGHPTLLTYVPAGPRPELLAQGRLWVRQYALFFWPRPWPLWMSRLPPARRPFHVDVATALLALLFVGGAAAARWGAAGSEPPTPPRDPA